MLKKLSLPAVIFFFFAAVISVSKLTHSARALQAEQAQWAFLQSAFSEKILSVSKQHSKEAVIYQVKTKQETAWLVINQGKGFSSMLHLAIIFDAKTQLKRIIVLQHNESASYVRGLSAWLHTVSQQWEQRKVDQLSGATISSRAMTKLVEQAQLNLRDWLAEGNLDDE